MGLVVLLQGLRDMIESVMILKGYSNVHLSTPQYWIFWGCIKIVFGLYLLVGVTPFVSLAFPRARAGTKDGADTSAPSEDAGSVKGNVWLMEPKAAFGIIVKAIGLIVSLYGLSSCVDAALYAMTTPVSTSAPESRALVAFYIVEIAAGLVLMRAGAPLVKFAFSRETTETQSDVDKTGT